MGEVGGNQGAARCSCDGGRGGRLCLRIGLMDSRRCPGLARKRRVFGSQCFRVTSPRDDVPILPVVDSF